MIDPWKDDLLTFADVVAAMRGRLKGCTLTERSLYRYAKEGRRGVVLETTVVGGKRYTTAAAVAEFQAQVAAAPTAAARQRAAAGPAATG